MEGGKTTNFWPGFVDALTNVVIAMVFVIVVLAIALSFSAQLLAKRMAARITVLEQEGKAAQAQRAASVAELIAKRLTPSSKASLEPSPTTTSATSVESADDTLRVESKMAAPIRINVKGNEERMVSSGGKLQPSDRYMLLEFAPTALTLDDAATKSLGSSLDKLKQQLANAPTSAKVVLVASGPAIELSESQRAGYLRAMAVRNELLEQGFAPERITTRFDMKATPAKPTISLRIEGSSP